MRGMVRYDSLKTYANLCAHKSFSIGNKLVFILWKLTNRIHSINKRHFFQNHYLAYTQFFFNIRLYLKKRQVYTTIKGWWLVLNDTFCSKLRCKLCGCTIQKSSSFISIEKVSIYSKYMFLKKFVCINHASGLDTHG